MTTASKSSIPPTRPLPAAILAWLPLGRAPRPFSLSSPSPKCQHRPSRSTTNSASVSTSEEQTVYMVCSSVHLSQGQALPLDVPAAPGIYSRQESKLDSQESRHDCWRNPMLDEPTYRLLLLVVALIHIVLLPLAILIFGAFFTSRVAGRTHR